VENGAVSYFKLTRNLQKEKDNFKLIKNKQKKTLILLKNFVKIIRKKIVCNKINWFYKTLEHFRFLLNIKN